MKEGAFAILSMLEKKKFEAYIIGGKVRNELHNKFHSDRKVKIKDYDIVTNATVEDIKKIFPNAKSHGESFQVSMISFGGHDFEVATYRKDEYDEVAIKESKKTVKPNTKIAATLDEDRERRDFTINAIAQNINGECIDYIYKYRNKKVSSIQDIEDGIIRAIGNAKKRFEEDPLRILRAFRFMSQLGYEIDQQTLKTITVSLDLLKKVPHERIAGEFSKLICGRNAKKTILLMKEIGIFDIEIFNHTLGAETKIMPLFNDICEDRLDELDLVLNNNIDVELGTIACYAIILKNRSTEEIDTMLRSINALCNDDIDKVIWLCENYNLVDYKDLKELRNNIYKSITGIVKRKRINGMKELLLTLGDIHVKIDNDNSKQKSNDLMFAFCSRPYFTEQLKIKGEEMMEIAGEPAGPWIGVAQEKLILKLVNEDKFPRPPVNSELIVSERYMDLVNESVEEAIFESMSSFIKK